jgi:hypothetical protein
MSQGRSGIKEGDYVIATKYDDGDPRDHFCVGLYKEDTWHNPPRYHVVDGNGELFRGNGFRRMKKISRDRGDFLVSNIKAIEQGDRSVWWWTMCNMKNQTLTK